jgi:two-component system, sensor histidine kinase and response regulator
VLMDCHMPVMDGFTATEHIRGDEAASGSKRLPIIAMTAGATAADHDRCLAVGMDDFVPKPVDVEALRVALGSWARATAGGDPGGGPISDRFPSPGHADDAAALDPERLTALRSIGPDDGWGLLPAVSEAFLQQAPALYARLGRASSGDDRDELRAVAHQFRGAAADVGAVAVAAVCQQLEAAAARPPGDDDGLLASLVVEIDRASRLLRGLRER